MRKLIYLFIFITLSTPARSQFLMDMVDTTTDMGKTFLDLYENYGKIRISGYLQPQFQIAQSKGAPSYIGGDFDSLVNNRFMLRRGRVRFDYLHYPKNNGLTVQFALQFDGTERGVNIRDLWGRVHENKFHLFSFTMGMFARPFSYEVNRSSQDRESPERGRLTQILMRTERDMGAMLSLDPRTKGHPLDYIKFDIGLFNGQGMTAPRDFDSHKDLIMRLAHKPQFVTKNLSLSGGLSFLTGGMEQNTKYVLRTKDVGGVKNFVIDSTTSNQGEIAPRKYYSADMQLKWERPKTNTELRLEYVRGTQTGTQTSSETPTRLFYGNEGHYIRDFDGAFFFLLQNIINKKNQIGVKYDWYDPNTKVKGREIGNGNNLNGADVKFSTLGFGYIHYIDDHFKVTVWYDKIHNEKTSVPGFEKDIKDDIFTLRLQFTF